MAVRNKNLVLLCMCVFCSIKHDPELHYAKRDQVYKILLLACTWKEGCVVSQVPGVKVVIMGDSGSSKGQKGEENNCFENFYKSARAFAKGSQLHQNTTTESFQRVNKRMQQMEQQMNDLRASYIEMNAKNIELNRIVRQLSQQMTTSVQTTPSTTGKRKGPESASDSSSNPTSQRAASSKTTEAVSASNVNGRNGLPKITKKHEKAATPGAVGSAGATPGAAGSGGATPGAAGTGGAPPGAAGSAGATPA
jgi:hypothetical protein